jgi:hypothetical protein
MPVFSNSEVKAFSTSVSLGDNFTIEVTELKQKGIALEEEQEKELFPGYNIRIAWIPPESTTGVWIELVDALSHP